MRGLARRVVTEEYAHRCGKHEATGDGAGGQQRRPVRHRGNRDRHDDTAQDAGDTARDAQKQAEENVRVAKQLYDVGSGTSTQVLDAESLRTTARTNQDEAQFDLAAAQFQLERAAGVL